MPQLPLWAPAKVNLYLEVLGRRPDGYHDLRMLMAPVSWFDRLVLEPLAEPGRVQVEGGGPEGDENLCARAARYYLRAAGVRAGIRISLDKRIPAGAGLGGGSSDAAAVVLGMERLFGRTLSEAARREAAFRVGADVPFFFAAGPAWVEGVGERVRPVAQAEPLWLVVVWPGVNLSTARVFSRFARGLTSPGPAPRIAQFNFRGVRAQVRNDLEPPARAECPEVAEAVEALRGAGAAAAAMTGSGSAAFGLYPDRGAAEAGLARLGPRARERGWTARVVRTLGPGEFPFQDRS
ncbi:4-(cytidine 5'-diphospho)-2-C-methyl-D-erythritol kinase [Deferrisoma camini]|uniref:4-(cytidine 5'-diphospho)-2-C-methyl-D-erythritol kinase n=1 Tax=Deferrisoma camini TaxID=1035120 RepID=UPI00046CFE5E|nr:4-(cytidine 5'-diphospho)-2-C-methyl-D-erythritol kinase [Deferrisoma camini]